MCVIRQINVLSTYLSAKFLQSGALSVFLNFFNNNWFFAFFIKLTYFAPVLFKKPTPSQISLITNATNHFYYWKNSNIPKVPIPIIFLKIFFLQGEASLCGAARTFTRSASSRTRGCSSSSFRRAKNTSSPTGLQIIFAMFI